MRFYILLMLIFTTKILYGQDRSGDSWITGYNYTSFIFNGDTSLPKVIIRQNCQNALSVNTSMTGDDNSVTNDSNGKFLFWNNGLFVFDTLGNMMPHGKLHHDSYYIGQTAFNAYQPTITLPKKNGQYYLFTLDFSEELRLKQQNASEGSFYNTHAAADKMYMFVVDMNANNGLGDVVDSNKNLLNEEAAFGGIYACKHANGKDWWLIRMGLDSGKVFRWLVTSNTITGPFKQYINNYLHEGGNNFGQICFNFNGSKIAIGASSGLTLPFTLPKFLIADFDRCTGIIFNEKSVFTEKCGDSTNFNLTQDYINVFGGAEGSSISGLAFSPNSKFIYICKTGVIFQYEIDSCVWNIKPIEICDGIKQSNIENDPYYGIYTNLNIGPDGRIYINTFNDAITISLINNPNEKGPKCNYKYFGIVSPTLSGYPSCTSNFGGLWGFGNIPNMPDFRMPANYSSCWPSILAAPNINNTISIYPNPSTGIYTINTPVKNWQVHNMQGQLIAQGQGTYVDVAQHTAGIYLLKIVDENNVTSIIKLLKE
jgi:Secretion system C-terminal sorting domain